MCGIFGVINPSTLTRRQVSFLSDAFIAGGVRGLHGSGMFTVTKAKKVNHVSVAVTGTEFLESPKSKSIRKKVNDATTVVGHNRFATSGDHEDSHCHPFHFGSIIGVHNGGIPEVVLRKIDPDVSHEVDSGRLYAAISKADNPIDVLENVHQGAYALVWYDKKDNCLRFARNGGRPMSIAVTKSSVYFASEIGMLTWLMNRNNLEDTDTELCTLDTQTLYTIPLDDVSKVTCEEYDIVVPVVVPVNRGNSYVDQYERYRPDDDDFHSFRTSGGPQQAHSTGPNARSRSFYDPTALVRMFPCLRSRMDFIQECSEKEEDSSNVMIPMLVYGIDNPYGNICTLYGAVSDRQGQQQMSDVLVYARGGQHIIMEHEEHLPSPDTPTEDAFFPVIYVHIDAYKVRPTGELIIQARPVIRKDCELVVNGVDQDHIDWARYACSYQYLQQQNASQLAGMWADLQAGKVLFNDDVPF